MHIENESVEIVTIGDHEFEEIIKEYEEEILVQEEVPEPPLTDSADTAPAQGKPQCKTLIFHIHRIYVLCIYVAGVLLKLRAYIYEGITPVTLLKLIPTFLA
jgi:hypothetical protein